MLSSGIQVKVYPDVSKVAVNAFLGIPYAQPPEGHLRFAIPQRHRGWNGTLYAANYGPVCPFRAASMGLDEKEDCLYLNIWTPEVYFKVFKTRKTSNLYYFRQIDSFF